MFVDNALELSKVNSLRVHHDLRKSVAVLRNGQIPAHEKRWISTKTGAVLARLDDPDWAPLDYSPISTTSDNGTGEVAGGNGGDEEWVEGECEYEGEEYAERYTEGYDEGDNGYGEDEVYEEGYEENMGEGTEER
jgi:hypothetical protein